MQPTFDSWDFEPPPSSVKEESYGGGYGYQEPPVDDPNVAAAMGLVDLSLSKGKGGKFGFGKKGAPEAGGFDNGFGGKGSFSPKVPAPLPPAGYSGKGPIAPTLKSGFPLAPDELGGGDFGEPSGGKGFGKTGCDGGWSGGKPAGGFDSSKGGFDPSMGGAGTMPSDFGKGGCSTLIRPGFGKGGAAATSPGTFGKGQPPPPPPQGGFKGEPPLGGKGGFQPGPQGKFGGGSKGTPLVGKGCDKGGFAATRPASFGGSSPLLQAPQPPSVFPQRPLGKGGSEPLRAPGMLTQQRAPTPMLAAPRLPFKGDGGKGGAPLIPQKGGSLAPAPMLSPQAQTAVQTLGNALAAVASAAGRGSFPGVPPPGAQAPRASFRPPAPPGIVPRQPPPPLGHMGAAPRAPLALPPVLAGLAKAGGVDQLALPSMAGGLAPELAALAEAEDSAGTVPPVVEKKPRLYLLVTRLAPEIEEGHVQQILEQCGEVQAWRRGRSPEGEPLSFGFAQFADPEAVWKASTCLSKRVLGGQEIKVLVEEQADNLVEQWRTSQKVALKVSTDEELEWELERKAVSCKALIDAKLEELYGPAPDGPAGGVAGAQRRLELREKENLRLDRVRKRKAWREAEFSKELERVESAEKRLRRREREEDDTDRAQQAREAEEKQADELMLANVEASKQGMLTDAPTPDNRAVCELVDRVQAQTRDELFKSELDVAVLRSEKTFEKKLRPWLERKVDFCMGGPQSDLVEYILRRVNAASPPDALISDLSRYLDDNAEPLVERMWRMLKFELMRKNCQS